MLSITTIENFQENLPVGGDADVFFINVIVQKHRAWVLPRLLSETHPKARKRVVISQDRLHHVAF